MGQPCSWNIHEACHEECAVELLLEISVYDEMSVKLLRDDCSILLNWWRCCCPLTIAGLAALYIETLADLGNDEYHMRTNQSNERHVRQRTVYFR